MSTDRNEIERKLIPGLAREGITNVALHTNLSTGYIESIEIEDGDLKGDYAPISFAEKVRPLVNKPADIYLVGYVTGGPVPTEDNIQSLSGRQLGSDASILITETLVDSILQAGMQAKLNQDSPGRLGTAKAETGHMVVPRMFERNYMDPEFIVSSDETFHIEARTGSGQTKKIHFPFTSIRDLANLKSEIMQRPSGGTYTTGFAASKGAQIKEALNGLQGGVPPVTEGVHAGWLDPKGEFITRDNPGDLRYCVSQSMDVLKMHDNQVQQRVPGVSSEPSV